MDCADCARHVERALQDVPGVRSVQVYLGAEKAVLQHDGAALDLARVRQAVEGAGYHLPPSASEAPPPRGTPLADLTGQVLTLFGLVFGAVLFVVVAGEWLGLFEAVSRRIPWYLALTVILAGGYPVFRNVARATLRGQVISHSLMTLGVIAAVAVGEWATAAVVVFFMRVGDYAERFTAERARRSVKTLTQMAPQTARLERDGSEIEIPIAQVQPGDIVVIRPGEQIPVDGEVLAGQATVDQATITGESLPVEVGPGSQVFAATLARLGSLRVRVSHAGPDSTFGKVIRMVQEAEAHRADVQRLADRFSAYYLPVVAGIAALTFLIRRDPLATAAVLVVACSCSFALATPIAILASIGAAARRGLLIKGGKHLETLARADILLIDKTGTLTLGQPQITDILSLEGMDENELLRLAGSVERYSEHPLAEAVRSAVFSRGLALAEIQDFEAFPGVGVRARVNGRAITVGRAARDSAAPARTDVAALESQGKSVLMIARDGEPIGLLAAADTLRPEVPEALIALENLGLRRIELLTGDNARTAETLAGRLGIAYQAELMPEDKIDIVKDYQRQGRTVVMVGDGVNDAPALAQADVGIAMGAAGSDVALEAAHIALMREDWTLVPEVFAIARRTLRVVKGNLGFTALYNLVGLSLAALGFLPPIFAAALQSLPDLGILANSSRLIRQ
jgi:Cd2+/Zn2+-exporting ATPase/Cu+-exporting ATPase